MNLSAGRVSWIADTEDALNLANNASEAQREFSNLQDLDASFAALLDDFNELEAGADVVRPLGWNGRYPPPELKADLSQAASGLGSRPLTRSVRSLERWGAEVKANLTDFWREYAAERMGDLAELQVLAATLRAVSGIAESSVRLEEALGELARNQSNFPSEQSAELLQKAELALRQVEDSLQPESVRRFLSAATRGGASLAMMTDDVLDWLRAQGALRSFKVIAGAPIDDADV
ncbi:hypothetical protein [Mycolicibacterium arenosum]|uniref:Uncharacterized protein n=1 Tax=Mycolicibacterium arenosum TaxID=2952157 RepID=A0ABT1M4G2_9MYCO|nr:hypothetical protein [Mycolicibacterium sp. CAU 1645]MCP9274058.1 hypothetical protein [Mycolicibacterium sp. CAU 1645]